MFWLFLLWLYANTTSPSEARIMGAGLAPAVSSLASECRSVQAEIQGRSQDLLFVLALFDLALCQHHISERSEDYGRGCLHLRLARLRANVVRFKPKFRAGHKTCPLFWLFLLWLYANTTSPNEVRIMGAGACTCGKLVTLAFERRSLGSSRNSGQVTRPAFCFGSFCFGFMPTPHLRAKRGLWVRSLANSVIIC